MEDHIKQEPLEQATNVTFCSDANGTAFHSTASSHSNQLYAASSDTNEPYVASSDSQHFTASTGSTFIASDSGHIFGDSRDLFAGSTTAASILDTSKVGSSCRS